MTTNAGQSSLALFMAAILADNPNNTLATNDLTISANAFYRSTYFHDFTRF
jgi:hypothetical protein